MTARAGRTFKLQYGGRSILVREGHDGRLEFSHSDGTRQTPEAKTFEAATNEARKWLLEHAGKMRGDYERDS